ncbi:hypothetical protein [Achromobacter arsenitoxydans]|uniref:Zinc ribbon domain-containing protein n=1 Tax=Achromobacter arsenitoxydans SY8 TaxID=477184 RepID=H0F2K1_9BURK|nr:hypothetical protein [Achromobacter arsenitoxydans]EHK67612.1 hypothetical protein KYC_04947 [Achromobacter arsenitoxydans SY8]
MLISIIFLWVALAIVVGAMAARRGRKRFGWTILACLISPVIAGLFLMSIADRSPHARQPVLATHVDCPLCGKRILREARVCRHCGGDVTQAADAGARTTPSTGYWYDYPDPSSTLERTGDRVALARAVPPWIVVDQSLDSIIIGSRWPGQLWRVRVEELGDMSGLVAQPGYWRAASIELLEAMPLATLFGPHGDAVLEIVEQIGGLSRAQAQALAGGLPADAPAAYGRAWARWSRAGEEAVDAAEDEWRGTLAAARRGDKARSPIHGGFLLIHEQLRKRAEDVDGEDAFILVEEDGETEQLLAPLWQGACDAFLYAAMARAAPQCVEKDDAAPLTQAWSRVYAAAGQRG